MKYIKEFELADYMNALDNFSMQNIIKYLGIKVECNTHCELKSKYDINVIDFLKEIFIGKKIIFDVMKTLGSYKSTWGTVEDIYQADISTISLYIKIKIDRSHQTDYRDGWYELYNSTIGIYDYDADTKPLHKKIEEIKTAEKYNL